MGARRRLPCFASLTLASIMTPSSGDVFCARFVCVHLDALETPDAWLVLTSGGFSSFSSVRRACWVFAVSPESTSKRSDKMNNNHNNKLLLLEDTKLRPILERDIHSDLNLKCCRF